MNNKVRGYIQVHPFHLVSPSPWPIFTSFSLMNLAFTIAFNAHNYINNNYMIILNIVIILYVLTLWFKDVIAESTYLGNHTSVVKQGFTKGFYLFVISEIIIFGSLFWAYLHSSLNPTIDLGMQWPPMGIEAISPLELPLLNTIILLASGVTITYTHHALVNGNRNDTLYGFIYTTLLIVAFVILQYLEYKYATFTISDGVYGSTFFSLTGLHGLHMIMLTIMLLVCVYKVTSYDFTNNSHLFGETTILYLHVLDVLWIYIYIIYYWWGS